MSTDIYLALKDQEVWYGDLIRYHGLMVASGLYKPMYESNGKTAREILPELEEGFFQLRHQALRFRDMTNGWDDFGYFLGQVGCYIEACEKFPEAIVKML